MSRYFFQERFFQTQYLILFMVSRAINSLLRLPKPPGKGLSPAYINVLWAAFNILVGIILFKNSRFYYHNLLWEILFFAGGILMALMLSKTFTEKHKE